MCSMRENIRVIKCIYNRGKVIYELILTVSSTLNCYFFDLREFHESVQDVLKLHNVLELFIDCHFLEETKSQEMFPHISSHSLTQWFSKARFTYPMRGQERNC